MQALPDPCRPAHPVPQLPSAAPHRRGRLALPLVISPLPYTSKLEMAFTLTIRMAALAILAITGVRTLRPTVTVAYPAALKPASAGLVAFGLTEPQRREIFAVLATEELASRQKIRENNNWGGHPWSQEDDRGWQERTTVRELAAKHKISLSQVYLVLDQGIRLRWPAADGKPLVATVPPIELRHQ